MGSFVSEELEFEIASSERSSRDDKAYEELLKMVTHTVAMLQLGHRNKRPQTLQD